MHIDFKKEKDQILRNLEDIEESLNGLDPFSIDSFDREDTLIVFIDVINGFISEGVYSNPLAGGIMDCVKELADNKKCIPSIAFADYHSSDSLEFEAHPEHALAGTSESELHESIAGKVRDVFHKDSINGFFAAGFKEFFDKNIAVKNIIVAGLVTDICVLNFCLTLKSYCNQTGRKLDIHVPMAGVESFDLKDVHSATLMNLVSASMMLTNSIKLYN
ncbi:Nicotinamidase-related amidase [Dethiosulfatibacter aminovorans DSM 17477]|uniref:Nicotinamidase-related amidase n=1 Tax=Dethiosulfatibacter aminovorans DSM 17477 TaxID=1121476 RepID=A0A1M6JUU8_9FIRM|nr:isochorismatase family protein [Dethiosulfatibacter aminovorans]SHJ50504.1 Nicotinamidase-related amidase [Dethiosulfatibacter aminovorans DSM 17477]